MLPTLAAHLPELATVSNKKICSRKNALAYQRQAITCEAKKFLISRVIILHIFFCGHKPNIQGDMRQRNKAILM